MSRLSGTERQSIREEELWPLDTRVQSQPKVVQSTSATSNHQLHEKLPVSQTSTTVRTDSYTTSYGKPSVVRQIRRKWDRGKRQAWWPYEIASWFLSLVCLTAIAAVVAPYEGRQSPSLKWGITLNTVVSILSTIATFALMIPVTSALGQLKWIWFTKERMLKDFELLDEASRGPLGSLKVLVYRRGGLLFLLGAFITIAVLAITPFVQQIISVRSMSVPVDQSSMPTIMFYDALAYNSTGSFQNSWDGMIEPTLASAILDAVYEPAQIPATVAPYCSTGNCSWPATGSTYQTLSICSSCVDLTHQSISNSSGFFMPSGFGLVKTPEVNDGAFFNISLLNMTALRIDTMPAIEGAIDLVPNERFYTSTAFWGHSAGGISAFAIVANATTPFAMECLFNFCVQTLNATEVNGKLVESQASSHPVSLTWLTAESPPDHVFGPSKDALFAINDFITQTLSGWVYAWGVTNSSQMAPHQDKVAAEWSSSQMNSIYTSLSNPNFTIDALSAAIARSMTINMRQSPGRMIMAQGIATKDRIVIHIVWPWITLPFALAILTLLLLIFTIRSSRSHAIQPWCNSALATLFHGLDNSILESLGPLSKVDFMQDEAGGLLVALRSGDARLRLKARQTSAAYG